ncbi:choice-of-anchor A family protein [Timonella senegalensis]|uniref:choice-of-anchor A family protein n=1 Tax=Timonella senegalensis TaxID=1465825 RepID=UPI0028B06BEC|nr:choice-of-anchor A family protein [Timonella senegalensis]
MFATTVGVLTVSLTATGAAGAGANGETCVVPPGLGTGATNEVQIDNQVNVFVSGDYTSTASESEGALVVLGDAKVSGPNLNAGTAGGGSLIVPENNSVMLAVGGNLNIESRVDAGLGLQLQGITGGSVNVGGSITGQIDAGTGVVRSGLGGAAVAEWADMPATITGLAINVIADVPTVAIDFTSILLNGTILDLNSKDFGALSSSVMWNFGSGVSTVTIGGTGKAGYQFVGSILSSSPAGQVILNSSTNGRIWVAGDLTTRNQGNEQHAYPWITPEYCSPLDPIDPTDEPTDPTDPRDEPTDPTEPTEPTSPETTTPGTPSPETPSPEPSSGVSDDATEVPSDEELVQTGLSNLAVGLSIALQAAGVAAIGIGRRTAKS